MVKFIIYMLLVTSVAAGDYTVIADSQHPSKTTPIDNLYEGESGTITVLYRTNGVARTVGIGETAYFCYGTNGLASTNIIRLESVGDNIFTFTSTNFPVSTPRSKPYIFSVAIGDTVYGHSELYVLDNPFVGSVADLFLRSYTNVNFGNVSRYIDTLAFGPYRAGSGISASTNSDGSVTFSTAGGLSSVGWDDVTNKPDVFAPDVHYHGFSDVTNSPWAVSNVLGSLAWLSSITSNDVDPDTDEAYRAGGETLWPASSNSVLTHVASHGVNEYGGFRAGTFIQGTGTDEEALFRSGILIGTNAVCRYDSIRLGHGSATKHATDSNSISIGNFSTAGIGGTAIGHEAQAGCNAVTVGYNAGNTYTGSNSVSIGYCADAEDVGSVAIGPKADALERNAIQLGQGENATENTFQVGEYPMLTLTDGLIPIDRLSGIESNQIAAATDTAYRNVPPTGITSNQMDQATDEAYRSATTETKSYWSLTMSGDQSNILGTNYNVMAFDTVVASGGASTIYTNTYSAKFGTTGVFHLGMRVRHSGMDATRSIRSQFLITGNAQPDEGRDVNASSSDSLGMLFQWNAIVSITNADATVQVTFYTSDTENDVDFGGYGSTFFGAKVSDL